MSKNIVYVKTPGNNYTTDELFQMIQGCHFSAGQPVLKEFGRLKKIKLPAYGQYCISLISGGYRIQVAVIEDNEKVGAVAASHIRFRFLGIFAGLFDKDKKPSQALLLKTVEELKSFLGV